MDTKEIKFEEIAGQARNWNFAGDNLLLQWMKQISQGLESRANQTTNNLIQLDKSIKETDIALNNMANSLHALQHGNQFVESRVKDDDDLLDDVKVMENANDTKNSISAENVLEKFLDNNIKMLRNCYERYSIDLDDDDTDDDTDDMTDNRYDDNGINKKTFVYQPKNPYNERPLPHIINTKEWHQNWHTGLPDGKQNEMNEYSEDDDKSNGSIYSENDDSKSYESNHTSNVSQWASSSNSLQNDTFQRNFQVKNASLLKETQQQILYSSSNDMKPSTTITTTSATNNFIKQSDEEINIAGSNATIATATTKPATTLESLSNGIAGSSSSALKVDTSSYNRTMKQQNNYRDNNEHSSKVLSLEGATTTATVFADLFAEAPPLSTQSQQYRHQQQQQEQQPQIKRKPINLFDDDDLQSFISEAHQKTGQRIADNVPNVEQESRLTSPISLPITKTVVTVSLPLTPPITTTSKTSSPLTKLLFDDDDAEEEDFFNIFATKSTAMPAVTPKRTKALFDNNDNENDFVAKDNNLLSNFSSNTRNLFDNLVNDGNENNDHFVGASSTANPRENKKEVILNKVIPNEDTSGKFRSVKKGAAVAAARTRFNNVTEEEKRGDERYLILSNSVSNISNVNSITPSIWSSAKSAKDETLDGNSPASLINSTVDEKLLTKKGAEVEELSRGPYSGNIFNDIEANVEQKELSRSTNATVEQAKAYVNLINNKEEEKVEESIKYNENHNAMPLDNSQNVNNDSKSNKNNEEEDQYTYIRSIQQNVNDIITSRPIIPTITATETITANTSTKQSQTLTNNYQLNFSLFLDEPPDDSEFFDNLLTTSSPSPSLAPLPLSPLDIQSENQKQQQQQQSLTSVPSKGHGGEEIEGDNLLQHHFYKSEEPKLPQMSINMNNNNEQQQKREEKKKKPKSVDTLNVYKNLQLFNDVPPDDDGDDDNDDDDDYDELNHNDNDNNEIYTLNHYDDNITKSNNSFNVLPNIFYDDLNETLKALNEEQQKQVMNNEEEKIVNKQSHQDNMANDDKSYTTENQASKNNDVHALQNSDENSLHNVLKLNKEREKVEMLSDDNGKENNGQVENINAKGTTVATIREAFNNSEIMTPKPSISLTTDKVSKLKMPNIQINVKALLPQASQSETKLIDVQQQQLKVPLQQENQKHVNIAVHNSNCSNDDDDVENHKDDENKTTAIPTNQNYLLTNVNKNRIKIPVKRQASTRKGRQENYKNSLCIHNENDNNNNNYESKQEEKFPRPAEATPSSTMFDTENITKANTSTNSSMPENLFDYENVKKFTDSSIQQILSHNNEIKGKTKNDVRKDTLNTETGTKSQFNKIFEYDDEDDDWNDLFVTNTKKIKQNEHSQTQKHSTMNMNANYNNNSFQEGREILREEKEEQTKKYGTTVTSALVAVTVSTSATVTTTIAPAIKPQLSTSTTLFNPSDNDIDEDDDLFSSLAVKKLTTTATGATKTSLSSSSSLPSSSVNAINRNLVKTLNENHSSKKMSLFSDSDSENDDDLFTKLPHEKLPKTTVLAKKDDTEQQKKQKLSNRKNLFGDDETDSDEADLFGSTIKKASTITAAVAARARGPITTTTIASKSVKKNEALTQPARTNVIKDNPLADLL